MHVYVWGTRWRSWLRHYATSLKVAGSIPDGVIGIFHWYNPPGVDSVSNKNEYQEYFLRGLMLPVRRADNLTTLMCQIVLIYGSRNHLEPSWFVQACNGIALPASRMKHTYFSHMKHLNH